MSVTVSIVQWRYYPDKSGRRAIKVRIAWQTLSKYVPVKFEGHKLMLSEADWEKIQTDPGISRDLRKIRDVIRATEVMAREAANRCTSNGKVPFSWERFKREFGKKNRSTFLGLFDKYLQDLESQGRIGTARTYKCAKVALASFLKKDIEVHDLTVPVLQKFENWLLDVRHVNKNTVAIYMRSLKVIWNIAAQEDKSLAEFYPFSKRKNERGTYSIRMASGHKGEALNLDQLRRLLNAEVRSEAEKKAKNLWIFSLYCHGMNFRDISMLKVSNVHNGLITYIRHKTRNTQTNEELLVVPVSNELRLVLTELTTGILPEDYLLNILRTGMTPVEIDKRIADVIKRTNKALKRICSRIGLPKVTTYWARHTYASMLKWNDVSIEFISEMLGHASTRTTSAYLRRFDSTRIAAVDTKLLARIKDYDSQEAKSDQKQPLANEPIVTKYFLEVA
ncbi:MAG: site-specific integrase [Cyclobacteriaceae bacterium]|nr:site-specific integrase [Cyclobacteriaceae bacterium]